MSVEGTQPAERLTPTAAAEALGKVPQPFVELFRHGSLKVEYYAPRGADDQQPHERDEAYVVIAGSGRYRCGDAERPFGPNEVLFAPAGAEHRFTEFTDDFATWVFFYGPVGGEAA